MARFAHSSRGTVVGTSARAMLSLFATADVRPVLREVGVFNTTATAVCVALQRFTAATNVGTGLAENPEDDLSPRVAVATVFAGHTGDGTTGAELRRATLGGAIGSGVIWTFGGQGIVVPDSTADGIGITVPTGNGQICDLYFVWDE